MNTPDMAETILQDAFEDVAFLIASVAETRHFDEALIWTLMRRLDRVRSRAVDRLHRSRDPADERPASCGPRRSHPAVEAFLAMNPNSRPDDVSSQTPPLTRKEPSPCHA